MSRERQEKRKQTDLADYSLLFDKGDSVEIMDKIYIIRRLSVDDVFEMSGILQSIFNSIVSDSKLNLKSLDKSVIGFLIMSALENSKEKVTKWLASMMREEGHDETLSIGEFRGLSLVAIPLIAQALVEQKDIELFFGALDNLLKKIPEKRAEAKADQSGNGISQKPLTESKPDTGGQMSL